MSRLYRVSEALQGSRSAVVFVHGLGGDAVATWRATPVEDSFWPRWVAQDHSEIEVWTVEYEASPSNWQGSSMALPDRAANLLGWFEAERLYEKKLVFIAHSLGGLVVKQLLRLSADRPGTPHQHFGFRRDARDQRLDCRRIIQRGSRYPWCLGHPRRCRPSIDREARESR